MWFLALRQVLKGSRSKVIISRREKSKSISQLNLPLSIQEAQSGPMDKGNDCAVESGSSTSGRGNTVSYLNLVQLIDCGQCNRYFTQKQLLN